MVFEVNFGLFLLIFVPPVIIKVSFSQVLTYHFDQFCQEGAYNTSFRSFNASKKQKSLENFPKIVL